MVTIQSQFWASRHKKTTPVVIDNITIRQDMYGRYCLNDLHKAAGGLDKDVPAKFFRLDTTGALIDELVNCPDMVNFTELCSKRTRLARLDQTKIPLFPSRTGVFSWLNHM